jgi:hypothetical protein
LRTRPRGRSLRRGGKVGARVSITRGHASAAGELSVHRKRWISSRIARSSVGVRNRGGAATGGRSGSQTSTGGISAHREFGMIRIFAVGVIGIILLLIWVWHVRHVLHVRELAVGCTSIAQSATLRLDRPLGVNVLVPISHGVFICISDNKIVDDTRVPFPENLNTVESCWNRIRGIFLNLTSQEYCLPGF